MKQKIAFGLGLLLELCLVIGAVAVYYFSIKRMGMARHVLYLNGQWEKKYPVDLLITAGLLVTVALAIVAVLMYRKNRPFESKLPFMLAVQSALLSTLFVSYGLAFDTKEMRAYYLIMLLLFAFCLVMNLMNLLVLRKKTEGSPGTRIIQR